VDQQLVFSHGIQPPCGEVYFDSSDGALPDFGLLQNSGMSGTPTG
jgi:hypothetical protein